MNSLATYMKIAKYAQMASDIGNTVPSIRKYGSDNKLSSETLACAAAMALRDQGARRQVMAILRDATPMVKSREAMLAAIQFNDAGVVADVSEIFSVDLNNVEWCSVAARAGKDAALSWLISKGAPTSSVGGFSALSTLVEISGSGAYWKFEGEHNRVLQLLGACGELEKLGSQARVEACDALGRILAELASPSRSFSKINQETIVAASDAFILLWPMMSQKERASARRGARTLLGIGADFGLFLHPAAPASGKGARKGEWEERLETNSKAKEWQESLPALRKLEALAASQNWLEIEVECQAQKWSLASSAMIWIENELFMETRIKEERVFPLFEKIEKVLGRPISNSKYIFNADGSRQGRHGMTYWPLSSGIGAILKRWVSQSDVVGPDGAGFEPSEILTWMQCYAKIANSWVGEKELPNPEKKSSHSRGCNEKMPCLEELLMPSFEQELTAWYGVCKNDELNKAINKLANEWGSAKIERAEVKSAMAAWSEKIEMTIASFESSPQSATRKKATLRV